MGEEPDERAVPDFARWKPPTIDDGLPMGVDPQAVATMRPRDSGEQSSGLPMDVAPQPVATGAPIAAETASEEGGDTKPVSDAATGFEGEIRSAELDGGVPVTVDGKGIAANLQNELPPGLKAEERGRTAVH